MRAKYIVTNYLIILYYLVLWSCNSSQPGIGGKHNPINDNYSVPGDYLNNRAAYDFNNSKDNHDQPAQDSLINYFVYVTGYPEDQYPVWDCRIGVVRNNQYWKTIYQDSPCYLRGIWGTSTYDVTAVGESLFGGMFENGIGLTVHYNGEDSISYIKRNYTLVEFQDLWGTASNDIWAVGERSLQIIYPTTVYYIAHYDGRAWRESIVGSDSQSSLSGVWAAAPDNVYAVGGAAQGGAMIMHYDGVMWEESDYKDYNLYSVWGADENNIFIVGADNANITKPIIMYYNGSIWSTEVLNVPYGQLDNVSGVSSDDVYAIGGYSPSSIIMYHYDGNEWNNMNIHLVGKAYTRIWAYSISNIYFTDGCNLYHYDGNSIEQIEIPVLRPEENFCVKDMWGIEVTVGAEAQ